MINQLLDLLAQLVISVIHVTGYTGVFLLMVAESCGIPAPSEVIMPFAGFLVWKGEMSFWIVVFLGTLGNLIGSLGAYYLGKIGGRPLIERFGKYIFISHHDLDVADRWFSRHGNATVFVGRLLPVIRTYISFPAGIAKMDVMKFSFYTTLGALPWSILFTWLGFKAGEHWESIRERLHNFDLAIAVLLFMTIIWFVISHLRRKRKVDQLDISH